MEGLLFQWFLEYFNLIYNNGKQENTGKHTYQRP